MEWVQKIVQDKCVTDDPAHAQVSESIFSLGNEYTGLRGYFEEGYSGASLQGSYLNGVYERRALPPSGYKGMLSHTEFMVNTVDWVYTRIICNGQPLDLAKSSFSEFKRVLDLRTGLLSREFVWNVDGSTRVRMSFERFTSMEEEQFCGQKLTVNVLSGQAELTIRAGLDFSRIHTTLKKSAFTVESKRADGSACEIQATTEHTGQTVYAAFCAETGAEELLPRLAQAAEELYVPQPDENGVIEQFDGYFELEDATPDQVRRRLLDPREYWGGAYGVASHTQVLKQADVVTMLELFHRDYTPQTLERNWTYYEPRTEHGSSLSACMYALLACRFGRPDLAYPFFLKSAQADWVGGGKQWAGLVYIGGTHPAASGGAWKVLAEGFAGLDCGGEPPRGPPLSAQELDQAAFPFLPQGKMVSGGADPG